MKWLNGVVGVICVCLLSSCMAVHRHNSSRINRALLQEYFLCCCLMHGFEDLRLDTCDISPSVYFDITRYEPTAFRQIDSIAKDYTSLIEPSLIEDHKGKKSIIVHSIYLYKSKTIKKIIKSMDEYMIK